MENNLRRLNFQSKRIFNSNQLESLCKAVDIAVPEHKPEKRRAWKSFLGSYVAVIDILTDSVDYTEDTINNLVTHMDNSYATFMRLRVLEVTNYFHYFGCDHIIRLIRRY
jgi:hypothetical protein